MGFDMGWNEELDRIGERSEILDLAPKMAAIAETSAATADFDAKAVALGTSLPGIAGMALMQMRAGFWEPTAPSASTLPPERISRDLLADTLDAESARAGSAGLCAAPLSDDGSPEILVVESRTSTAAKSTTSKSTTDDSLERVSNLAGLFSAARRQLLSRLSLERRLRRLQSMLKISQQWRQTQELSSLLEMMAEASTELLDAERASIFLWDEPNRILFGRPALGVEGGELRIADDQGVVGDVMQSGELRRVDADPYDQREIDRSVDKQLNFETRTLLCAPLRGAEGQMFGAFELINKRSGNFTKEDEEALLELAQHASIALESTQQHEHLIQSRNQVAEEAAGGVTLIGNCPAIQALRSKVERVANTDLSVLILGENGCGKEVVSQMIHYLSDRRSEPIVAVNCAAITESLLESELFGHEAGAFTGAVEMRVGKFELAAEGTLFLDEIGDMSSGGQAKLLRVLEEKLVVRVGGVNPIHTNARVIAATNQDLGELVQNKRFREDLFFRLNVVTLELPPLNERGDDIILLAEHFLNEFALKARRKPPKLMASARKRLLAHAWPGNVRELRNVTERLAFLSMKDQIDADELALNLVSTTKTQGEGVAEDLRLDEATKAFQADYIQRRIDRCRGNVALAARELGLHRSNLYRKMRQLEME